MTLDNDADVKATYNPRLRHMDDSSMWDPIFYFLINTPKKHFKISMEVRFTS